jgi:hypothetical protein
MQAIHVFTIWIMHVNISKTLFSSVRFFIACPFLKYYIKAECLKIIGTFIICWNVIKCTPSKSPLSKRDTTVRPFIIKLVWISLSIPIIVFKC